MFTAVVVLQLAAEGQAVAGRPTGPLPAVRTRPGSRAHHGADAPAAHQRPPRPRA
ncbi:hypothetical protein CP984_00205 [Streptomyces rimosus]|nr:hypothetical protein CP984_00205 [Streptomyces rimosus]